VQRDARIRREEQVRSQLSRYLAAEVVEQVLAQPTRLALGGVQREVTVLFADIVGFTLLSEALPPQAVAALLNEHFTIATEVIQVHGGLVDKFIGDCVMAVWGAVEPRSDDAERALACAAALLRWLEVSNRRFAARYGITVQLAIGVHSGPAVAGNLGSEKRMEFTVVGDVVNVAARLEAMAQPGQVLCTAATFHKLARPPSRLRPLGEHVLRGRLQGTHLYELRA
jgi:adenylate cyclase